jgi:predicted PurR-regulated permease PerM
MNAGVRPWGSGDYESGQPGISNSGGVMNKVKRRPASGRQTAETREQLKFSQWFLVLALIGLLVLFVLMIKSFIVPIILAGVFASLFFPLYEHLTRWLGGRASLGAFLSCITLLLLLLIPVYLLVNIVAQQAVSLYDSVQPQVQQLLNATSEDWAVVRSHPLVQKLHLDTIDWEKTIQEGIKTIAASAGKIINITSKSTFLGITYLLMTLFTMFYFFRDGVKITRTFFSYLPLSENHKNSLIVRFNSISRATVKGTIILGFIQGILGGVTLWIFGFSSALLWGMVMVFLSILPFLGSWMVLLPAAIFELAMGRIGNGLGIALISILFISNIDNVLRPRLVGRDAGMHDLVIFFSTLGGIGLFGIMGFIVGPVVAALMITLLDIYGIEFKKLINSTPSSRNDGR